MSVKTVTIDLSNIEDKTLRNIMWELIDPDYLPIDRPLILNVPVVDHLDAKILKVLEEGNGELEMSQWHTCETTHCRAGWAIALAGPLGKTLDEEIGSEAAGSLIYFFSTGAVPSFFSSNNAAMESIETAAEKDPLPTLEGVKTS